MPFEYNIVVVGKDEFRIELTFSVEKREHLKISEGTSDKEAERLKNAKLYELKGQIVEQIIKELGEVKSSVATGVRKEATEGKTTTTGSKPA